MKSILFTLFVCTSLVALGQQLPSQVQAKRGVFTERLFLKDRWIDGISTDLNTSDSANNNVLATGKAIAEFIKLHSGKNLATDSLTADSNYTHNWNHKQLHIDSIYRLQFDAIEDDPYHDYGVKVHNSISMNPQNEYGGTARIASVIRNEQNTADSNMISQIFLTPRSLIMQVKDSQTSLHIAPQVGERVIAIHAGHYDRATGADESSEILVASDYIWLINRKSEIYMTLAATRDTTTYKPVGINPANGKLATLENWPGNTGRTTAADTSYWPGFLGHQNVAGTSNNKVYAIRVGDIAYVSGMISVRPINAGGTYTAFDMSLPWPSDLVDPSNCIGSAWNFEHETGAQIVANYESNRATFKFKCNTNESLDFTFSFQYRIINTPDE